MTIHYLAFVLVARSAASPRDPSSNIAQSSPIRRNRVGRPPRPPGIPTSAIEPGRAQDKDKDTDKNKDKAQSEPAPRSRPAGSSATATARAASPRRESLATQRVFTTHAKRLGRATAACAAPLANPRAGIEAGTCHAPPTPCCPSMYERPRAMLGADACLPYESDTALRLHLRVRGRIRRRGLRSRQGRPPPWRPSTSAAPAAQDARESGAGAHRPCLGAQDARKSAVRRQSPACSRAPVSAPSPLPQPPLPRTRTSPLVRVR
ncbi:hypothetical protein B0H15DRAFT_951982 [Mycena belliarum]|uniref:Uncharacterized protein n=1 Tax=Mycena belliarum TaxID=1033014 RepID=A0AAD6TZ10_9AGAR|nr:hypothetical protein B0H15DRAFT_951982 [Mycena belliae]